MREPIRRNRLELISLEDQLRFKKRKNDQPLSNTRWIEGKMKAVIGKPTPKEENKLVWKLFSEYNRKTGKKTGSVSEAMHGLGYNLPEAKQHWKTIAEIRQKWKTSRIAEEFKKNTIASGMHDYMQYRMRHGTNQKK